MTGLLCMRQECGQLSFSVHQDLAILELYPQTYKALWGKCTDQQITVTTELHKTLHKLHKFLSTKSLYHLLFA